MWSFFDRFFDGVFDSLIGCYLQYESHSPASYREGRIMILAVMTPSITFSSQNYKKGIAL